MAKKFLTSINLSNNELQNAVIQNLSTAPPSPVAGQIYYDTTNKGLYQYNGTVWKAYTQSGSIVNADISSSAAIDLAKLATNPLARANHTGTQTSSTISDLSSVVKAYSLDTFAVPVTSVSLNSQKIINLANPVSPTDAANKSYVDSSVAGLTWKPGVNLLANTNIALTGSTGSLTIDGHPTLTATHNGYRLLLVAQTTASDNGIYVYSDAGSGYTLGRAADAATYNQLIHATVFVDEGTAYGKTSWTQSADYITSFSGQVWVQFSGASALTAGAGLVANGNAFDIGGTSNRILVNSDSIDISPNYIGQASITTTGTLTIGSLGAGFTAVAIAQGGTGATTAAAARVNLGVVGKYTATNPAITISSGIATWTITAATHGLGAIGSIIVEMKEVSSGAFVGADLIVNDTTGDITASWNSSANIVAGTYRIIAIG